MSGYEGASRDSFPITQWSLVRSAADGSLGALTALSQKYVRAVYAYFRRDGHDRERAADLTQDFFARTILDPARRRGVLVDRDETRVKFRTYLRRCLRNHAINVREHERAQKRGGDKKVLSLDVEHAERAVAGNPNQDPAAAFDRQWARDVVERVMARLFDELEPDMRTLLQMTVTRAGDREIGLKLGLSENAVAKARSRVLNRGRELLTLELRESVETPEQLKEELEVLARVYKLPRWLTSE